MPPCDLEVSEVVTCAGPPQCPFQGDEAVANAIAGCPLCQRVKIHADGTETEYRIKPN